MEPKKSLFSWVLAIILFNTLAGCGGTGGNPEGGKGDIAASYIEHCGLRNDDGTEHIIPPPHQTTGRRIVVNADKADNGNDDRPTIENAINEANPGDEVYLPNGTYNLNSTWSTDTSANIFLKSGVNLIGESREGVILKTNYNVDGQQNGINFSVIRVKEINNLTISDLTVTSTWHGTIPTNTGTNNPESGGPFNAIRIGALYSSDKKFTYNVTVQNVTVERFLRAGIAVGFGSHDITITNCKAKDTSELCQGGYGFSINGFGHQTSGANTFLGTMKDCCFVKIDGCTIEGAIRHAALIGYSGHNCLITNCIFNGTPIDSIDLHGEDEYNNELSFNTVSCVNGESGIGIGNPGGDTHDRAGPYNWIHDNKIDGCARGITCEYGSSYQLIEKNTITNSKYWAIGLGKSDHSIIRNNTVVSGGTKGIWLFHNGAMNGEPEGDPTYCSVTGNLIDGKVAHVTGDPKISDTNWATNTLQ